LAIHTDWLIHYFRADMSRAAAMKREEEAFLADILGLAVLLALATCSAPIWAAPDKNQRGP